MLLEARLEPVPDTVEEAVAEGRRIFEEFGIPVVDVGPYCPDSPGCPRCGFQIFVAVRTDVYRERVTASDARGLVLVLEGDRRLEASRPT